MTQEQFELFYVIKKRELPFEERYRAVLEIHSEIGLKKIEESDIQLFYDAIVDFWRSLGLRKIDRENEQLFSLRRKIANVCISISIRMPQRRNIFRYYPKVLKAEGFDSRTNAMRTGTLKTGYGTSLYEFHYEYPIEGFGIKKDLIKVITSENKIIPMLEWCKENDIIVFCNRCGLEITQEVNKDCPFMKKKLGK